MAEDPAGQPSRRARPPLRRRSLGHPTLHSGNRPIPGAIRLRGVYGGARRAASGQAARLGRISRHGPSDRLRRPHRRSRHGRRHPRPRPGERRVEGGAGRPPAVRHPDRAHIRRTRLRRRLLLLPPVAGAWRGPAAGVLRPEDRADPGHRRPVARRRAGAAASRLPALRFRRDRRPQRGRASRLPDREPVHPRRPGPAGGGGEDQGARAGAGGGAGGLVGWSRCSPGRRPHGGGAAGGGLRWARIADPARSRHRHGGLALP